MQLAKAIKKRVQLQYYRYELTTALYMLDFWEKCIFNGLFLLGFVLFVYTSLSYSPAYLTEFLSTTVDYFPAVQPLLEQTLGFISPPLHAEL
ncbi:hypothetical protein BC828DRAFT_386351 [Blastocladiella britannica]|nr:hypothetical protein BC828DRAFT_386351 [Blastocladiella britannica]